MVTLPTAEDPAERDHVDIEKADLLAGRDADDLKECRCAKLVKTIVPGLGNEKKKKKVSPRDAVVQASQSANQEKSEQVPLSADSCTGAFWQFQLLIFFILSTLMCFRLISRITTSLARVGPP
jgi:hypothetical protein